MKACILIAGYLRTFNLNYESYNELFFKKYKDLDIYFHVTKNESQDDKYLNNSTSVEFIRNHIKPLVLLEEKNIQVSPNKKMNDLYNMWYKFYRLNELKCIHELAMGFTYDIVIKLRPDIHFKNYTQSIEKLDYIHIPTDSKIDIDKLSHLNDPYMCDVFAYGSSDVMNMYFDIYLHLNHLIDLYGTVSETILYYYLVTQNIPYVYINVNYEIILSTCNVFAIAGDSGSGKSTLGNILKGIFVDSFTLECDAYHKWERGDDMWKKYTHLNPEANYIVKMQKDLFDLKTNHNIYQVEYNHTDGKFTDTQIVSSVKNIVICGLHCLYTTNNHVFNVKIFMDTDESLRINWKLNRDVTQRGYTLDCVEQQIINRKQDYEEFIKPQMNNADIIVKFIDNKKMDSTYSLQLTIHSKYNMNKLSVIFTKYNIKHVLSVATELFNTITFNNYQPCTIELYSELKHPEFVYKLQDNFYDIIVFVILYVQN